MFKFTAPLAFLRRAEPPRTSTWNENPVVLEDTHDRPFSIEFGTPTESPSTFSGTQTFPQKQARQGFESSFYMPPPHYHLLQDEYFHVISGEGIWHLWGGRTIRLKRGDEIMVPAGKWHTFDVAPESTEPLAVAYRYDAEYAQMEERFFRNVLPYFADCRKAGLKPSIFQLMVFCMHNWMPIALPVPGPQWFNFLVNTVLMVVLGSVGQFLLGYKTSYPEYYREESSGMHGKKE